METLSGPRILIVDDDRKELDRTLDTIRTHCASYEARVAEGAFEGLDYLFGQRRYHPLPDLVLLDVGMTPLDGVQVLKRIAEADYLRDIPIALLCNGEEERQRAMKEGVPACAFITKPMTTDSLRTLLRQRARSASEKAA